MNNSILSPAQSRDARHFLGLSQSKVARATGVARTKLALFEVQKYLLDGASLHALRRFYEQAGCDFGGAGVDTAPSSAAAPAAAAVPVQSAPAAAAPTGALLVDGYAVPAGADEAEVEAILDELDENDQVIAALSAQPAELDWYSDEPEDAQRDEIVRRMARNYELVRRLQGRESAVEAGLGDGDAQTNGMLVHALLDADRKGSGAAARAPRAGA